MELLYKLLIAIFVIILLIFIYVGLIMIIWNNVITKKIGSGSIKNISFWDAMAIAVFAGLLSGSGLFGVTLQTGQA